MRIINNEVEYIKGKKIYPFNKKFIDRLKKNASRNKSGKYRTCLHKSIKDSVHEMIVVHTNKTYVKPHKHFNKSETLHVIEGTATVIIFDNNGKIKQKFKIGDYKSGYPFLYKMEKNIYHSFIFHSKYFVFKETTKGPFDIKKTKSQNWKF